MINEIGTNSSYQKPRKFSNIDKSVPPGAGQNLYGFFVKRPSALPAEKTAILKVPRPSEVQIKASFR